MLFTAVKVLFSKHLISTGIFAGHINAEWYKQTFQNNVILISLRQNVTQTPLEGDRSHIPQHSLKLVT